MAWNEPGNNNDKDPWGNRKKSDGPPDLDEVFGNLGKKIGKLFGGGGNGGNGKGSTKISIWPAVVIAAVIWAANGFYTINEQEKGVVLHFGKFDRIEPSGLGWVPPGIERVYKVNVNKLKEERVAGSMLTKDLNVIDVEVGIQYRVDHPKDYLFNLAKPDNSLVQITESALRQVVGDSQVDDILTTEKERIRIKLERNITDILSDYGTGLKIEQVTLEKASPPPELNDAFEDVNRAEQDAKRMVQNAEAYRNQELPLAEAKAEGARQQAQGYKAKVLGEANGEVARFNKLLPQYTAAPKVTRDRLYIAAIEKLLSSSTKIMVDVEGGNNMMYIPLDKMINKNKGSQ